jgi:acyl carrier protein
VTRDEVRAVVVHELSRIAPELDPTILRPDAPLRDQIDIDSMDFLNFIIALHDRVGVDIPEADYAKLSSLNTVVDYVSTRSERGKSS